MILEFGSSCFLTAGPAGFAAQSNISHPFSVNEFIILFPGKSPIISAQTMENFIHIAFFHTKLMTMMMAEAWKYSVSENDKEGNAAILNKNEILM